MQHQTDVTNSSQKYSHMVGVSTDIVNTGTLPALTFYPLDLILGLSLNIRWDNQGSCGSKSLHIWLRRTQATNSTSQSMPNWPKVSLSTSTYALDLTYSNIFHITNNSQFSPLKGLLQVWLKGFFSSRRFYISAKPQVSLNTSLFVSLALT